MNLGFDFRRGLEALPTVLEAMTARINTIWNKQHKPDGTHGPITGDTLSVTGRALTGALRVEGPLATLPDMPDGTTRYALDIGGVEDGYGGRPASRLTARRSRTFFSTNPWDALNELDIGSTSVRFVNGQGGIVYINQATAGSGSISANGLIDAVGGQIRFPTVQIPSAAGNVLDDYREGTWIPVWSFGGSTVGPTYSSQSGNWLKIGKYVYASCRLILSNLGGAAGQAALNMPPITGVAGGGRAVFFGPVVGLAGGVDFFLSAPTQLTPVTQLAAGSAAISNTNFTNTTDMIINIWYIATA